MNFFRLKICFRAISIIASQTMTISVFVSTYLRAAEYFVAPNGAETNPGTFAEPYANLARAQKAVAPGDTVWLRGGEYVFEGTETAVGVLFDKSGTEANRINYFAYQNETPVFDFFKLATRVRIKGFNVKGNWLHFKGIELKGVQQILVNAKESWAVYIDGGASHNIFEQLNLHHNEGPGLFIAGGNDNLVLNCDSHHNYDPDRRGENADGFGVHYESSGNVLRGCRAWYNSDDGYDFISCRGVTTVEHCWSWRNGFVPDTLQSAGNGGGFKCGGFGLNKRNFPAHVPRHIVRFNLAFLNKTQGFYANHHPGGLDFFNNTAFSNPGNFVLTADVGTAKHTLHNNLAYGTGSAKSRATEADLDDSLNSWNGEEKITDADFLSVTPEGMDGHRQADGSLPVIKFMQLAPGSKLIDAGKDLSLPYKGKAPDLGAFEIGAESKSIESKYTTPSEAKTPAKKTP